MDTLGQHTVKGEVLRSDSKQRCPECGAIMTEADRLAEGRDLFVWYTCSRVDCGGQWLQKFSRDTKNV